MSEKQCVNCPGRTDHTTAECWVRASLPDGYMPIPTAEQLADALSNVRCFHDMSAELIAPELLANLLASTTVKAEQVLVTHDLRAKLISGLDEIGALSRNLRQGGCDSSDLPGLEEGLAHAIGMAHELISLLEAPYLPAAGLADLTAVRCQCCATEYPHDSYDAGFIAGSGMCQVCDAAMPPKDLPAAGSAVEEVEVVAYQSIDATRGGGYMAHKHQLPQSHIDDGALQEPLMTVAQHNRIVAALSAQQSAHVSVQGNSAIPNNLRAEFEAWLGIKPRGAAHELAWKASRIALAATPAPEVPDHIEQHIEMAEQGERQETNQDVRGLVEALEECAASLAWNCFGECRAIHAGPIMPAAGALEMARTALATYHQDTQPCPTP